MQFTLSSSIAILSYCASIAATAVPYAGPSPIYGEHEHRVYKDHPHFNRNMKRSPTEAIVVPTNLDAQWLWRDPESCGWSHGLPFNWVNARFYKFRNPNNDFAKYPKHNSWIQHIHLRAGARINQIKLEWHDEIDGGVAGSKNGGSEVAYSPLQLEEDRFWINGMVSGCCKFGGHTRLCYAEITTNRGGEVNTLVGGRKTQNWRTSKPACCKAVAAYGHSGREVDSFNFVYLKRDDYQAMTELMPGYPGQLPGPSPSKIVRRAFTVGKQSNDRIVSTDILGDEKTSEKWTDIDHATHLEDNYRISKIVTYCSDRVEGIQLTYTNLKDESQSRTSEFHGLKVGQLREMELEKGDYVHTVDNSNCSDPESGRSQVCGLVFHTFLMQQHACGQSTVTGKSQSVPDHAMLTITGAQEGEVLKNIGINWIPVEDHH